MVDWTNGSDVTYARAVSNSRVVGAQIALLINYLQNQTASTPQTMHLIGHSLGAQIAGYAGERLTNLARISGNGFFKVFHVFVNHLLNWSCLLRRFRADIFLLDCLSSHQCSFQNNRMHGKLFRFCYRSSIFLHCVAFLIMGLLKCG